MIAALKSWFDGRTIREQRMLLVMVGAIALSVLWFGIVSPVRHALITSQTRLDDAAARLGKAEAERDAIARLTRHRPPPIAGALADYVRTSAGDAGFALSDVVPQNDDRVEIAIPTARPGALFAWIAALENAGVVVASIALSNNGNQSVAATITLIERAS